MIGCRTSTIRSQFPGISFLSPKIKSMWRTNGWICLSTYWNNCFLIWWFIWFFWSCLHNQSQWMIRLFANLIQVFGFYFPLFFICLVYILINPIHWRNLAQFASSSSSWIRSTFGVLDIVLSDFIEDSSLIWPFYFILDIICIFSSFAATWLLYHWEPLALLWWLCY